MIIWFFADSNLSAPEAVMKYGAVKISGDLWFCKHTLIPYRNSINSIIYIVYSNKFESFLSLIPNCQFPIPFLLSSFINKQFLQLPFICDLTFFFIYHFFNQIAKPVYGRITQYPVQRNFPCAQLKI